MYLKRLEIVGFKTFASRTVLEFEPGISAIIGPNGSGKSNIVDAVRWVLGEQSFAALRSKRTEDLLFGGGTRRAPSGFAEVLLTIDNSDKLLPLPYAEVTIGRRATRAGETEYTINRSRVRLRDLQEAIGPLGGAYTIINQGLVDAALNLRPEDRRQLFEDAAEIGVYEGRRAEAERRLRETAANLDRVADILSELEPRLRSLKRQASLARTYREYAGELRALLLRHYAALWRDTSAAREAAERADTAASQALEATRTALAAHTEQLQLSRETLRADRVALALLHSSSAALHTQAETLQRELAVANERRAALIRQGDDLAGTDDELALRSADQARDLGEIRVRLSEADRRASLAKGELAALDAAVAAKAELRRALRLRLDAAQRAEYAAAAGLAERARRAAQIGERRGRLGADAAAIAEQQRQSEHAIAEQRRHAAAAASDTARRDAEHAAAALLAEQARATIERARAARAAADETLAQRRRAAADAEARLDTLSRLQRSQTGTFAGVRAALQWAEQQRRGGFTLVSGILEVPAAIETAVEVALGSRLQNIVVDAWADAEAAIESLKRSGAGRATFLPLDTLRPPRDDQRRPPADDAVLGVAADLVSCDERYRPVAQFLLGRTLIVADLSTARRELRALSGGWSIVTLAGEQVSTGGAVTGGAQTRETGTLRRERELRELPGQLEALRAATEAAVAARAAADASLAAAERSAQEADAQRRALARDLESARAAAEQPRRAAERAENELSLLGRRAEQIAADAADLDAQEIALAAERAELEAQRATADASLAAARREEDAAAAEERELSDSLAGLRAAAAAADGEARAERALLQAGEQAVARIAEQRQTNARRAASLAAERAALDDTFAASDARHAELLGQIDLLRIQIEPREREIAAQEAQIAADETAEAANAAALRQRESDASRASLDLQRARDRIDTLWERAAADDIDVEQAAAAETEAQSSLHPRIPASLHEDSRLPVSPSPDPSAPPEDLAASIASLRSRIARLGAVNPLALEEYEESAERHSFLSAQSADLRKASGALGELIAELNSSMRTAFERTFAAVAAEFEQTFVKLFGGGQAKLTLAEPEGGGESIDRIGIEIVARPPGKRLQNLALLSGGERSLTAVALLFAILRVNPSPFCVMDEVDAALDEANVGRFREALAELTEQTQFLVVTHNRTTIEIADTIYGVSMTDDSSSKVLSVKFEQLGVE